MTANAKFKIFLIGGMLVIAWTAGCLGWAIRDLNPKKIEVVKEVVKYVPVPFVHGETVVDHCWEEVHDLDCFYSLRIIILGRRCRHCNRFEKLVTTNTYVGEKKK